MSQGLLDALPRPALVIDPAGRIARANAAALGLLGDAIVGRHHITALRQPMLLDAIEKVVADDVPAKARYLATEAKKDITLLAHCAPIKPDGGILIFFEDLTALEDADQMRRDFVANVSHELKTPLTAMTGFIETLQGAAKDDPESRDRFLEIMQREAARMNRLVSDLLSLSRVESSERVRPTTEVDIATAALAVVGTLGPVARDAGVRIETDGLDAPCPIRADADQIAQVITNLMENAIKYSGQGTEVRLSLARDPDNRILRSAAAVMSVSDQGEGIDPMHIPRLTERFYRIDTHRSRELGGTGLGLAIVKHIVNRHRGRLRIESQPGRGSRFTVILPVSH
ncbi:MAG: PAS domain-containing protein [Boseongicola sp.]|nr:PAS domain-containing protein [Boseongicola sp.]